MIWPTHNIHLSLVSDKSQGKAHFLLKRNQASKTKSFANQQRMLLCKSSVLLHMNVSLYIKKDLMENKIVVNRKANLFD